MFKAPRGSGKTAVGAQPSWEPPVAYDLVLTLTPAEFERLLIALSVCGRLRLSHPDRLRGLARRRCSKPPRHRWCRIGKHSDHRCLETLFG